MMLPRLRRMSPSRSSSASRVARSVARATGTTCAILRPRSEMLTLRPRFTRDLPPFVERELPEFLTCGVLSRGFARVRGDGGALERPVPFSCNPLGLYS